MNIICSFHNVHHNGDYIYIYFHEHILGDYNHYNGDYHPTIITIIIHDYHPFHINYHDDNDHSKL